VNEQPPQYPGQPQGWPQQPPRQGPRHPCPPQEPQAPQHGQQPRKSWIARYKVLTTIGGIVAFFIIVGAIGAAAGGKTKKSGSPCRARRSR
jgi:hypothetical protein